MKLRDVIRLATVASQSVAPEDIVIDIALAAYAAGVRAGRKEAQRLADEASDDAWRLVKDRRAREASRNKSCEWWEAVSDCASAMSEAIAELPPPAPTLDEEVDP